MNTINTFLVCHFQWLHSLKDIVLNISIILGPAFALNHYIKKEIENVLKAKIDLLRYETKGGLEGKTHSSTWEQNRLLMEEKTKLPLILTLFGVGILLKHKINKIKTLQEKAQKTVLRAHTKKKTGK